eukprot:5264681-Pyramimonas_sp.AAC.1
MGGGPRMDPAAGAFGGAPCWATIFVRGVPKWVAVPACGPCHWGLRWSSLWGREPCEGYTKVCGDPRMRILPLEPS